MHQRLKKGGTLLAACAAVGAERNRDGGKSGAVEKNYRKHRADLEYNDSVYAKRRAEIGPGK